MEVKMTKITIAVCNLVRLRSSFLIGLNVFMIYVKEYS